MGVVDIVIYEKDGYVKMTESDWRKVKRFIRTHGGRVEYPRLKKRDATPAGYRRRGPNELVPKG